MKRGLALLGALLALLVAGCQPVAAPAIGILYLNVKGPIAATDLTGTREGRACAQSIMGLVATGDASIEAAKRAGGIEQVAWIDHESTSTLGIIGEFCTIVHGK